MSKASDALVEVLREMNATPGQPLDIYAVGIPMVMDRHFTQEETLDALVWLQSQGRIRLIDGNRLRLLKLLPDAN
jgi:hypothetical protein